MGSTSHSVFRSWLSKVDDPSPSQRVELEAVLAGRPPRAAVKAVVEARQDDQRRCPHCSQEESVARGRADGLRRFRCKPWDRLKIGGQAAIAIDGDDSLVGWNVCP